MCFPFAPDALLQQLCYQSSRCMLDCAIAHCAADLYLHAPPPPLQVECCIRCLSQGVTAAHIIDGRSRHSVLMELLTDEGVGTMITG
jgi:hypothetical protein